jgi:FKBP-type peptidyl-prolyl cis-trans isomerase SlyD
MKIAKHTVAMIEYELTDDSGNTLDSSKGRGPLGYVHGVGSLLPSLEAELEGKGGGDAFQLHLDPENGYGERDEGRIQDVPKDQMPPGAEIEVGMQLAVQTKDGEEQHVVIVSAVDEATVTLDANHPLAGVPLNFDVKVVDVREATQEEIEHGHPHGPGGHEH